MSTVGRSLLTVGLRGATLAPAIWLVFAIQLGALTHPFWDHVELTFLFAKLHDGTLAFGDLLAPHNHSRPLVNRALLLWNGWLTDWDLRAEYVFVVAAILGALLLHLRTLRRSGGADAGLRGRVLGLLFALLCCSPVGHNNHWWSQQLQLDLANLFVVAALSTVALAPQSWHAHALAAASCWLATYTLSNGFVAFVTCAVVSQWANGARGRPDPRTWFWLANLGLALLLYLPGLGEVGSTTHPTALQMLDFAVLYLGAPVAGLIRFPFTSMFDLPHHCDWNRITGLLLLLGAGTVMWRARARFRARTPAALLCLAFATFAAGSALMTAWGRAAFDAYGVANANGSRFAIFGAYLPFALLYLAGGSSLPAARWPRWLAQVLLVAFCCAAANAYRQGLVVYRDAHRFDRELSLAYAVADDAHLAKIHPDPAHARAVQQTLLRLRIGPYRGVTVAATPALEQLAAGMVEDEFGIGGMRLDAERGRHLFAHPHSVFHLPLPAGRHRVHLRCGIYAEALTAPAGTDGVEFCVRAGAGTSAPVAWQARLDAAAIASRGELAADFEVVLAGDDVLAFETHSVGTSTNDWAYWRDLAVATQRGN